MYLPSLGHKKKNRPPPSSYTSNKPSTFFLAVKKNSPKWILILGTGFCLIQPGSLVVSLDMVAGYMLGNAKHVCAHYQDNTLFNINQY